MLCPDFVILCISLSCGINFSYGKADVQGISPGKGFLTGAKNPEGPGIQDPPVDPYPVRGKNSWNNGSVEML